jgi:lysyl-tRNA synthetase class II
MRLGLALGFALLAGLTAPASAQELNDFPTNARAEYVFACMATNGQNRNMLDRCSCAIDQIASVISYEDYVSAETVLAMQQVSGERASMFRGMPEMSEMVATLRRAEAEAEILCF